MQPEKAAPRAVPPTSRLSAVAASPDTLEVSLPLDGRGPRAARTAVVTRLRGHVPPAVLDDAALVVSELVTNAVRHSTVPDGVVVVCVTLTAMTVRLEVADPGSDHVVAPRAPDLGGGGGFGLHVVRAVSERWGLEQVAAGGTRVWAQLALVPTAAPAVDPGGVVRAPDAGRY
jgi:anti-sigma regulatory factor (Ser/Thr protein kinase)